MQLPKSWPFFMRTEDRTYSICKLNELLIWCLYSFMQHSCGFNCWFNARHVDLQIFLRQAPNVHIKWSNNENTMSNKIQCSLRGPHKVSFNVHLRLRTSVTTVRFGFWLWFVAWRHFVAAKEHVRNFVKSVYETTLVMNITPIKRLAQKPNTLDSQSLRGNERS